MSSETQSRMALYAALAQSSCASKPESKPTRLGILGSTRGTASQAVIDAINQGKLNAEIVLVASNVATAGILERAELHNLKSLHVSSKGLKRETFDRKVSAALKDHGVELVLLVGYMRILSDAFVDEWRGRVLNVHPSLLPDFAGGMDLQVHTDVIQAGKKESGCTVHLVTEEVDGGAIVVQKRCPVLSDDIPETLKARVQAMEGPCFIEAIERFQINGNYDDLEQ
jgi:phosphoribosylglycinamide formyltransferase-1